MNTPPNRGVPPDFTDEASYRAYLKAVAAGLVSIKGETMDSHQAQAQLAALNGNANVPPDFTDEASYRAYLKAEANGQIKIFGKPSAAPVQIAQAQLAALNGNANVPPDFTDEASYRAYLKAEANGQIKIVGKPSAAPVQIGKSVGLATLTANPPTPLKCVGRNGEWVDCPSFPGIEVFRPAA